MTMPDAAVSLLATLFIGCFVYGMSSQTCGSASEVCPEWQSWQPHKGNELLELVIPPPSGIVFSEHYYNGMTHRIGRVDHSVIAIRNEWSAVNGIKNVISPEYCRDMILLAETYANTNGGWGTTRHANYPTTGKLWLSCFIIANRYGKYEYSY